MGLQDDRKGSGLSMDTEMEKLSDELWNLSLSRISKKEQPAVRPSLGDDVDLYVAQTRTLLLLEANPNFAPLLYQSSGSVQHSPEE